MKINVNCVVNLGFSLNSGLVKSFDNIGKDFVQYCSHQMNWRSNFLFLFFIKSTVCYKDRKYRALLTLPM